MQKFVCYRIFPSLSPFKDLRLWRTYEMNNVLFYLGLGTFLTHELDAISNREWRLLPVLHSLPDDLAMNVFVLLHIPLFAVLLALVSSTNDQLRKQSRLGVSIFLVIHAGLHLWFMNDIGYEFASTVSNVLIFGGAVIGGLHLAVHYMGSRYSQ